MKKYLFILLLFAEFYSFGQVPIELYRQFNGRYNHTAIGNTLNILDNSLAGNFCEVLPQSSADLLLAPNQQIVGAYLYWSGPINPDVITEEQIDDMVTLNGNNIVADEIFTFTLTSSHRYFACFTDITDVVQGIGNSNYTLTDLDLGFILTSPYFCTSMGSSANQTNYGGWALSIVYEQDDLPYNQVSVFNGLDGVSSLNNYIPIELTNLNVIDDDGAKIAFLAWEGDENLANGESLFINGNQLSNAPLNPANNAFNGTNSYTNSDELYNMDLDFYSIQNNIAAGDTEALIELRSLQDLVMINYVVTVLNSQLPDATVQTEDVFLACDNKTIQVDYTIFNINSTEILPANTPIAFYANGILIANSITVDDILIGDNEVGTIIIALPDNIPTTFFLTIVSDDNGEGVGTVQETNENNNSSTPVQIDLLLSPFLISLPNIENCDEGYNTATFDLTKNEALLNIGANSIQYYTSYDDAVNQENEIDIPTSYLNTVDPEVIFIRVDNLNCYQITSFNIGTINCPPWIPSGFSPNFDGINDEFNIQGLLTIFENFELKIFNRYGTLIYKGGDELGFWDGKSNKGINNVGEQLPVGTYYYVLYLNDSRYQQPLTGWVYMNY